MNWRTKFGLALLFAVTAALIWFLIPPGSRQAVAAFKRELTAKGEKLHTYELAPIVPSNPVNGARAFTNAASRLGAPANLPNAMKLFAPGLAQAGFTNVDPKAMEEYPRNLRAAAELRSLLNVSNMFFDLDYSNLNNFPVNYLAEFKGASMLASATAVEALHENDTAEALADLLAGADLVRLIGDEPLLIADLVRIAILRLDLSAAWEALQYDHWTDQQLAQLQARWEAVDLFASLERNLKMERATMIGGFLEARQSYAKSPQFVFASLNSSAASNQVPLVSFQGLQQKLKEGADRWRYLRWKMSWSYDEELYFLKTTEAALEAGRRIKSSGAFVPVWNDFLRQATNIYQAFPDANKRFQVIGASPDGGTDNKYVVKLAQAEVARRLLVTAIALKRWQLQHGSYPKNLQLLTPDFLVHIPLDLMDGKPLRYRKKPSGAFVLYSVGEDGEDNGGDPTLPKGMNLYNWVAARDIVWPHDGVIGEDAEAPSSSNSSTNHPGASRVTPK